MRHRRGKYCWNNFFYADCCGVNPLSGYCYASSSKPDVAYDPRGTPATLSSGSVFTLGSAFLTAAWNNGLNLEITGFSGATQMFDRNIVLSQNSGAVYTFGWSGIDRLVFTPSGRLDANSDDVGVGTEFVLDDISLTPGTESSVTPEPATMSLVAFGLVGLAGAARRRRRA
jgi:MYXO-CTERM domain-containing protein